MHAVDTEAVGGAVTAEAVHLHLALFMLEAIAEKMVPMFAHIPAVRHALLEDEPQAKGDKQWQTRKIGRSPQQRKK